MAKRKSILLTKESVDAAKPNGKRYVVWDSDLAGFGLRVGTSGEKTFVAKYRAGGGGAEAEQRWLTIGRYGALTAFEARKLAKAKLGAVAAGADPAAELKAKRSEMLVSELVDLYEKEGCVVQRGKRQGEAMKPRTKAYTIARLRHHVVPLLGRRKAPSVNAGDIERLVSDITAGRTARDEKVGPRKRIIVRGGAGAARKVVRDLSAVFSFARRREIVTQNPCDTAAVRKTDNENKRFLTLEEVTRLGGALDELEAEGVNLKAVNIARLWALTGCRRDEVAGLKWSEANLKDGLLELDDTKTGESVRPLGGAAMALLKSLEKVDDSDFVFPAERGKGHYQGTKAIWTRAIKKADLPGVTPHTLRHTMGSTAISAGEAVALTGAILGHNNPRSTAIYAHVQTDPSRKAANRVSKMIAAALAGKSVPDSRIEKVEAKPGADEELLQALTDRLAEGGKFVTELQKAIAEFAPDQNRPQGS